MVGGLGATFTKGLGDFALPFIQLISWVAIQWAIAIATRTPRRGVLLIPHENGAGLPPWGAFPDSITAACYPWQELSLLAVNLSDCLSV